MKVAVIYNRDSKSVINLFGMPNREKIGRKTINRLVDALKRGGHEVIALEGDKDLVARLEEFMPRVVRGERPGMAFNVSYGIQGQARYTHVPSILEMVGIPYVASGPLAHSLALDKVVTKIILKQHGLPTPEFVVLQNPDDDLPDLPYPMVVKPKNEAVSFGLGIVNDEAELRKGAKVIFEKFGQAVLAEQYIEGREINVGLLGNNPPETFPPVELTFGTDGPAMYTYADKTGRSGRTIGFECPAKISPELTAHAQDIARRAFEALGIADCARVDMRMDGKGNLYILELNSLPSLGEHGSYLIGAAKVGLDFPAFVNRLVEVASARYFGTPAPPALQAKTVTPTDAVFSFVTQRRGQLETRLKEWVDLSSRTDDPIGITRAFARMQDVAKELGLRAVAEYSDAPDVVTWETSKGFQNGTLFIAHVDVPALGEIPRQPFRREAEWLLGEGVGTSRAPLVTLEYALRALRSIRRLRSLNLGVLLYADEGHGAQRSAAMIAAASAKAKRVLVLRPGTIDNGIVTRRRGQRRYRLELAGPPILAGRRTKRVPVLQEGMKLLQALEGLSTAKSRAAVATLEIASERHPMRLPHRMEATVMMTYPETAGADLLEERMKSTVAASRYRGDLVRDLDRPAKPERAVDARLAKQFLTLAAQWDIPLKRESSVWASAAGLVRGKASCLCGIGPVTRDRGAPTEAVQRISLVQRTLLLAEYLVTLLPKS